MLVHQARRLVLILGLALAGLVFGNPALAAHRHHSAPVPRAKIVRTPAVPIHVPTPQLLVDMVTGDVLYEVDAGAPWHPASLTKLMTAYVTFEALAQGRVTLNTIVTMSQKAINQAPAKSGLPVGDTLTLKDALYVMLVKSANDMAVAVAETVAGSTDAFVAEMNATAQQLGLSRTHYNNVNGLPDDGQVTTARDLAVLAIDLRRTFPQYDDIFHTYAVMIGKSKLRSENELLTHFAGTTGMKTGYICASGLNIVATVNRNGRQLMAVLLGGASGRERDQRAAQLLLRGLSGEFADSGRSVVTIADDLTSPPTDMKPLLCGSKARQYVAQQRAAFPMGLRGQPSYLTDKLEANIYHATDLGPEGASASGPQDNQPDQGDGGVAADASGGASAINAPTPLPPIRRR